MENIKIALTENGTTTLATAGKYCDRNVDVEVNVAGSGGDIEVEPLVLENAQSYGCAGAMSSKYIEMFGDTVSTANVTDADRMFYNSTLEEIPFDINCWAEDTNARTFAYMFNGSKNLKSVPIIHNAKPSHAQAMFGNCQMLRYIPDETFDNWDFTKMSVYGNFSGLVSNCYSLRKFPMPLLKGAYAQTSVSYLPFYNMAYQCYALDEIVGIPVYTPKSGTAITNNMFNYAFYWLMRVARVTFETNEDGTAKVVQWKNQTLDLENSGYASTDPSVCLNYNSGITADKVVSDDASYQALKNDPDWTGKGIEYARYNKTSALETINSLPDTSAYLATAGGTNTLKLRGAAGSATDGGAINTLTEEEIAIATAKGWTVTLS